MQPPEFDEPAQVDQMPDELALVALLRSLRRSDRPRAVWTRRVEVRLRPGDEPVVVHRSGDQ